MNSFLQAFLGTSLIISMSSCVSTNGISNDPVKKIYATYTVQQPGNIPVDPDGNPLPLPRTVNYVVYVETSTGDVNWDEAWIDGGHYKVNAILLKEGPFDAGVNVSTGRKMIINPSKNNQLWQLELQRDYKDNNDSLNKLKGELILQGNFKGKKVIHKTSDLVEIEGFAAV